MAVTTEQAQAVQSVFVQRKYHYDSDLLRSDSTLHIHRCTE